MVEVGTELEAENDPHSEQPGHLLWLFCVCDISWSSVFLSMKALHMILFRLVRWLTYRQAWVSL